MKQELHPPYLNNAAAAAAASVAEPTSCLSAYDSCTSSAPHMSRPLADDAADRASGSRCQHPQRPVGNARLPSTSGCPRARPAACGRRGC